MSSQLGVSDEKIEALANYATSELYEAAERVALEYADSMTITGHNLSFFYGFLNIFCDLLLRGKISI